MLTTVLLTVHVLVSVVLIVLSCCSKAVVPTLAPLLVAAVPEPSSVQVAPATCLSRLHCNLGNPVFRHQPIACVSWNTER